MTNTYSLTTHIRYQRLLDLKIKDIARIKIMRVLTNLPLHLQLLLASSRRLSAGPVVSGFDSAAPTRFWFFCALSKFSVESLINIVWISRNINLTTIQNTKTEINYIVF